MRPSREQFIELFIDRKQGSFRPAGRFLFVTAFFVQSTVPEKPLLGISACLSYAIILGIGSERINRRALSLGRSAVRLATLGKYGKTS